MVDGWLGQVSSSSSCRIQGRCTQCALTPSHMMLCSLYSSLQSNTAPKMCVVLPGREGGVWDHLSVQEDVCRVAECLPMEVKVLDRESGGCEFKSQGEYGQSFSPNHALVFWTQALDFTYLVSLLSFLMQITM